MSFQFYVDFTSRNHNERFRTGRKVIERLFSELHKFNVTHSKSALFFDFPQLRIGEDEERGRVGSVLRVFSVDKKSVEEFIDYISRNDKLTPNLMTSFINKVDENKIEGYVSYRRFRLEYSNQVDAARRNFARSLPQLQHRSATNDNTFRMVITISITEDREPTYNSWGMKSPVPIFSGDRLEKLTIFSNSSKERMLNEVALQDFRGKRP